MTTLALALAIGLVWGWIARDTVARAKWEIEVERLVAEVKRRANEDDFWRS